MDRFCIVPIKNDLSIRDVTGSIGVVWRQTANSKRIAKLLKSAPELRDALRATLAVVPPLGRPPEVVAAAKLLELLDE